MCEKNPSIKYLYKQLYYYWIFKKISIEGISNACLILGQIKDHFHRSSDERNMTRKTRTRQPRIHTYQSGYCAVCHIPYSSIEEHVQNRKHIKLTGEDANFVSLNEYIDQEPIVNLSLDRKTIEVKMPRTRSASVTERFHKDSSMSPKSDSGHHLRSRKNINYMTPPLDEDSLTEKTDTIKDYPRELRSSTRLINKLIDNFNESEEVWNSGRPKRTYIKQRCSADERLVVDNKSYYKVEVLPSKLRSAAQNLNNCVVKPPAISPTYTENLDKEDDKTLVFKFKKLRYSELVQLNNEAENFLFPKKEESNSDEEIDENIKGTKNSMKIENSTQIDKKPSKLILTKNGSNTNIDKKQFKPNSIKHDDSEISIKDEENLKQNCENKSKKKRRTHAEAFIRDNEKYYKFETPGSRLRYQGTYLPSVTSLTNKIVKKNGESSSTTTLSSSTSATTAVINPSNKKNDETTNMNLNNYEFAFERAPQGEFWYQTFKRRDNGQEVYPFFSNYCCWDSMILPYQVDKITPLDPQYCISRYNHIKKYFIETLITSSSASTSASCTPDPSGSNSSSMDGQSLQDEDSKISATVTEVSSLNNNSTNDDLKSLQMRKRGQKNRHVDSGRNPRKSPRQHASTLAILSSLIHQRKRKSKSPNKHNLSVIKEEEEEEEPRKKYSKVDYFEIARSFEEEVIRYTEIEPLNEIELESDDDICFNDNNKISIVDIINNSDKLKISTPKRVRIIPKKSSIKRKNKVGRKPGKKKKNRTGWPNINKRLRKIPFKKNILGDDVNSTMSVNLNCENSTDSISNEVKNICSENNNDNYDNSVNINSFFNDSNLDRVSVTDNESNNSDNRKLINNKKVVNICESRINNNNINNLQPFVRVQKLDNGKIKKLTLKKRKLSRPKRNIKEKKISSSQKSPRILRRQKGRWYRER